MQIRDRDFEIQIDCNAAACRKVVRIDEIPPSTNPIITGFIISNIRDNTIMDAIMVRDGWSI